MTYKEKRDHKFKILFAYYATNGDIDSIMSYYFDNYPYDDEGDNLYVEGNTKAHKNIAKVVVAENDDHLENESDKAVVINLSDEDNVRDIKNKIKDIISKTNDIDELIKQNLTSWDLKRVGKAELVIIRLAIYEMYYDESIDIPVAINEAIELAKAYGDEKAGRFVNGVLATIYKNKK